MLHDSLYFFGKAYSSSTENNVLIIILFFRPPAGYYTGCLMSALLVGRMVSALFWGVVADRYGRRPVLFMALGSIAVFSIAFGFSTSFWAAFTFRSDIWCACVRPPLRYTAQISLCIWGTKRLDDCAVSAASSNWPSRKSERKRKRKRGGVAEYASYLSAWE